MNEPSGAERVEGEPPSPQNDRQKGSTLNAVGESPRRRTAPLTAGVVSPLAPNNPESAPSRCAPSPPLPPTPIDLNLNLNLNLDLDLDLDVLGPPRPLPPPLVAGRPSRSSRRRVEFPPPPPRQVAPSLVSSYRSSRPISPPYPPYPRFC
ncbi:hypothetical protein BD626DRAFT_579522 [Schizophyllum amplum]|uniref:Uncharacterized protein n=1 Tax=Schizophyllum amplum TaxID=97359 RepID=A0A550BRH7_9AGAR|nr:hypothetical protein BD626DRAFT_579522 [Auriculariopsis ampla]